MARIGTLEGGADAPLYLQLARELLRVAREQGSANGGVPARLPSERSLCEELGVSRTTVRRALESLAERGEIVSRRGLGWFIARETTAVEPAGRLISLSEMGRQRGFSVSARVLRQEVREASLDEAELMSIVAGTPVLDLWRVRAFDHVVVAFQKVLVRADLAPEIERADFTTASLYAQLEERYSIVVSRGECSIEARGADGEQAEALGVEVGSALLWFHQVGYDQHARTIELSNAVYRGDRYRLESTLSRGPDGASLVMQPDWHQRPGGGRAFVAGGGPR